MLNQVADAGGAEIGHWMATGGINCGNGKGKGIVFEMFCIKYWANGNNGRPEGEGEIKGEKGAQKQKKETEKETETETEMEGSVGFDGIFRFLSDNKTKTSIFINRWESIRKTFRICINSLWQMRSRSTKGLTESMSWKWTSQWVDSFIHSFGRSFKVSIVPFRIEVMNE